MSLPAGDVEFLHAYARKHGLASRSSAVHKAIRLLRASELGAAYEGAWAEWDASDDAELWEGLAVDVRV